MKKYAICLFVLISILPVFADFVTYNKPRNFNSNLNTTASNRFYKNQLKPYHYNTTPIVNLSKKNINALEKYALNKSYRNESDIERLIRLENLAFGATQIGDLNTRYNNVEQAILARPKNNFRTSTLNNLTNYFIGQSTGFTPNIFRNNYKNLSNFNSYPYIPSYSNNNIEHYSNGIFGGVWGFFGHYFGNGTSVKILD